MCTTCDHHNVADSLPRPVEGTAVDPIALEPVEEVWVTTLVDNVFDGLLPSDERVERAVLTSPTATVAASQFERGEQFAGLVAEHGYSTLITVRRGDTTSTILFDTGLSPDAMVTNADRMEIDLGEINTVVLSHGHFDHAGGLVGMARRLGERRMPMVVHPAVWTRRRLAVPGSAVEFPTLSRSALEAEGFEVIERRDPSLLLDGHVLITGEVDRTTEFEHGMPPAHEMWDGSEWRHDAAIVDDQAVVIDVRGKGLVVVTGCGHAGAINIVRHAMRLTGVDQLAGLIGGLHLGGPYFEPVIAPTVTALQEYAPALVVPGHCTGWKAQHVLASALPGAWVAGSSGSTFHLTAA